MNMFRFIAPKEIVKNLSLLVFLLGSTSLFAQEINQIEVDISAPQALNDNVFGLNGALMFWSAIDSTDNTIPADIMDAIDDIGNGILRFPGGAISDDFHYGLRGYGGIKEEHEQFDHSRSCNTPSGEEYCYQADLAAVRNYLFDYIDLAKELESRRQQPVKTLYVLNFLGHSAYGQDQFLELDVVEEESDLEQLVLDGKISEEIRDGMVGNLNALRDLIAEPSIEVVGIEIGNELYFHKTFTGVTYSSSLNAPVGPLKAAFEPRIPKIEALFACYDRLIDNIDSELKTAIPISKLSHNVNTIGNFDEIWNEAVRDHFLQHADGVIIHDYHKRSGNNLDPTSAEDTIKNSFGKSNADKMDQNLEDMYERYDQVTDKAANNGDFFKVVATNKEMWVTEYNVANNNGQWINFWRNTFLHGVFMMDHALNFYESSADYNITKIIAHNLLGGETSYRYACISVLKKDMGNNNLELTTLKRVNYFAQQFLTELNDYNVAKISGPAQPTSIDEYLFHSKYFLLKEKDANPNCKGKVLMYFANTSQEAVSFNTDSLSILESGSNVSIKTASIKYMSAPHIYSSNGLTIELSDTDTTEESVGQNVLKTETDLTLGEEYVIPKYSFGYITLDLDNENCGTVVNAVEQRFNEYLTVFPVPATNQLTFELTRAELINSDKIIELYDPLGRSILLSEWKENGTYHSIDITGIPNGIYHYRISLPNESNGVKISGKVVVSK